MKRIWLPHFKGDGTQPKLFYEVSRLSKHGSHSPHDLDLPNLREAVQNWMMTDRPDFLMCEAEITAKANNITIIWGIPCLSEFNAIENGWGVGKAYTKAKNTDTRSSKELILDIRDGLYSTKSAGPTTKIRGGGYSLTDPDRVRGVPAKGDECGPAVRLMESTYKVFDEWVRDCAPKAEDGEPWLEGTIDGGMKIHKDLLPLLTFPRRALHRWISHRVAYDLKAHVDASEVEDHAEDLAVEIAAKADLGMKDE